MYKNLFLLLAFSASFGVLTSCSDDEDYSSRMPKFSNIEVGNNSTIHVGDTTVVTVIQSDKGARIYGAQYTWECDDAVIAKPTTTASSPTAEPNPANKLVFSSPGYKTLRFKATYKAAGQGFIKMQNVTQSGFSVTYTGISTLYGSVTVQKTGIYVAP